jgi:hypothetical protein
VTSAIFAAVGVLAMDVALGVRGLGTFVTVSVDGEGVVGIGIIVVVFIALAVAVGRITAGNRGLETSSSVPRSWACSRKYFLLDLRFSQCVPIPSLLGRCFEDRKLPAF